MSLTYLCIIICKQKNLEVSDFKFVKRLESNYIIINYKFKRMFL